MKKLIILLLFFTVGLVAQTEPPAKQGVDGWELVKTFTLPANGPGDDEWWALAVSPLDARLNSMSERLDKLEQAVARLTKERDAAVETLIGLRATLTSTQKDESK